MLLRKKAIRVTVVVLSVIAALILGFTIFSHAVYHRSDMATLVEIYFRVLGTKDKFSDAEKCEEYIEQRRNAVEYVIDVKLKSNIAEEDVGGSRVYTLTKTQAPAYRILYLHGGAYINDASSYHWKLCDRLVQELNAEVIFPIYPLAPVHTYAETYELLETIYKDELVGSDIPVIFMGDSAGGGLAAAFCEYLSEIDLSQPEKLILFSPWLDISMTEPKAADYESSDPMLSAYGLTEMGKYWADGLPLDDYKVSPIFGNVSGLQNVYLFVGTREIFYPDVTAFYDMLLEKGISSKLYVGEGMNHVYPLYPIPEADEAFDAVCAIIRN